MFGHMAAPVTFQALPSTVSPSYTSQGASTEYARTYVDDAVTEQSILAGLNLLAPFDAVADASASGPSGLCFVNP